MSDYFFALQVETLVGPSAHLSPPHVSVDVGDVQQVPVLSRDANCAILHATLGALLDSGQEEARKTLRRIE